MTTGLTLSWTFTDSKTHVSFDSRVQTLLASRFEMNVRDYEFLLALSFFLLCPSLPCLTWSHKSTQKKGLHWTTLDYANSSLEAGAQYGYFFFMGL